MMTVESALAELQEMFPNAVTIEARQDSHARYFGNYPGEKVNAYTYGLVTLTDEHDKNYAWRGATLAEAMAAVRDFAKSRDTITETAERIDRSAES